MTHSKPWSGRPDPADPDNVWINDETEERVCAHCGRSAYSRLSNGCVYFYFDPRTDWRKDPRP